MDALEQYISAVTWLRKQLITESVFENQCIMDIPSTKLYLQSNWEEWRKKYTHEDFFNNNQITIRFMS